MRSITKRGFIIRDMQPNAPPRSRPRRPDVIASYGCPNPMEANLGAGRFSMFRTSGRPGSSEISARNGCKCKILKLRNVKNL